MLDALLVDLGHIARTTRIELIVTENIPDPHRLANLPDSCATQVICNDRPKGFGANHNQAFQHASGDLFCVLNPDVRLAHDPFPALRSAMKASRASAVAPAVIAADGSVEDSARHFPTPWSLVLRLFGKNDGCYTFALGDPPLSVDWVAGMFVLFDGALFRRLGGFDEGFFLYCEDVDISARVWKAGRSVVVCPVVQAVHNAQRTSHRKLKYLRWHIASYMRYFVKYRFGMRLPAGHG